MRPLAAAALTSAWALLVIAGMLTFGIWAQATGTFDPEGVKTWFVFMWPLSAGIIALPIVIYANT